MEAGTIENRYKRALAGLNHICALMGAYDRHINQRIEFNDDPEVFKFTQSVAYLMSLQLKEVYNEFESILEESTKKPGD